MSNIVNSQPVDGLPDPEFQSEFYSFVAMKRLIAWAIDASIVTVLTLLLSLVTFGVGFFFWGLIYIAIGFSYRVVTLSAKSATLGMRLVAIEFREKDGRKMRNQTAALHTLGYYASMTFFLAQIVSIILMLTSARGQSLTDMFLGTAPINRPSNPYS